MAYKILIIDDDIELLKMLRKYFEIKRYEIITTHLKRQVRHRNRIY